ncbi:hypothetical protein CCACVL1_28187 [Corchorus capsularis]|uniref:Uncharacterized protein n=1 Tax=Corchorus capsularis TaxID=210143 RepID=A0A1R3G797_COCAP|nr:hypothetical protein CCACVL1_28187 [Corchorus capsularis]
MEQLVVDWFRIRASLGRNPAFIWRSLLAGRKVLTEGCHWRVGDGAMP